MINKLREFIEGVAFEMNKVSWPTWEELKGSTYMVLILSGIVAIFLFIVDRVLRAIIGLLI